MSILDSGNPAPRSPWGPGGGPTYVCIIADVWLAGLKTKGSHFHSHFTGQEQSHGHSQVPQSGDVYSSCRDGETMHL